MVPAGRLTNSNRKSQQRESNPRPADYRSAALPAVLCWLTKHVMVPEGFIHAWMPENQTKTKKMPLSCFNQMQIGKHLSTSVHPPLGLLPLVFSLCLTSHFISSDVARLRCCVLYQCHLVHTFAYGSVTSGWPSRASVWVIKCKVRLNNPNRLGRYPGVATCGNQTRTDIRDLIGLENC